MSGSIDRRTFLLRIGGTTLAVPAVLVMTACGGDGGGPDAGGQSQFTVASTGSDHVHQITIQCSELTAGNSVTYTSTTGGGHTHDVTLTGAELAMIGEGGTVTKTTTTTHTHTWTINKPSLAC